MVLQPLFQFTLERGLVSCQFLPCGGLYHCHPLVLLLSLPSFLLLLTQHNTHTTHVNKQTHQKRYLHFSEKALDKNYLSTNGTLIHTVTYTCTLNTQLINGAHSGPAFLGALPPLQFLKMFLVVLDHVGQTVDIIVSLLQ